MCKRSEAGAAWAGSVNGMDSSGQGDALGTVASEHHQRGLDLLRESRSREGLAELARAVERDPGNAEYHKSLGNAQKVLGDVQGAMASYRRSLEIASDYLPAHYNLGLILRELNRLDEAEQHFRRAFELDPNDPDVLSNLAAVLAARSRFAESVEVYRTALQLTPGDPFLWLGMGMACQQLGQQEESVRSLRQCVELTPDIPEGWYWLGMACRKLGRTEEAAGCYRKTLELDPENPEAHNNLGNLLQDEGRLEDAVAHYRTAIRHSPDYAQPYSNLGSALLRRGRLDEAIESCRKAIELLPDFVGAYLNLGSAYGLQGARDRALECYQAALRLEPDNSAARESLLFQMQEVCDWSRFEELCEAQRRSVSAQPDQEVSPFSLLSIPASPAEQLQCARNFAARRLKAVSGGLERLRFRFERKAGPRIKVGYLSADFHEHATAYLMAELFELHDRTHFEIAAYSYGPDDASPMRARLVRAFDNFVDLSPMSHEAAAARIYGDQVDILVDLKGYTQHARTEIVALRPAPLQVSYLGYPGTMGADFIDYLVTDRFITPPGQALFFTEKLVYLPGTYQVNDRRRSVADTPERRELGLPEGAFVFCCFNQTYKILPPVFAAWMRLLKAVPGSVLWLLESNHWAAQNLRREAQSRDVDPERLIIAPKLPLARHLARLRAADLFLDTLPYNAHTTASDALWVGLPVLTCAGEAFPSRVAGSLLTAAGLPELVTYSMDEYESLARRLAQRPEDLVMLREKLIRNRSTAALFDTPGFARHLEAAYSLMWENYLAGNGPHAIVL
ncbi:MAG: tetratricopeptide repeat protein [Betaproteobacteria bacterium]|nr:tetratricopeptide repeat protein [Betaproteobacteria bacterium]